MLTHACMYVSVLALFTSPRMDVKVDRVLRLVDEDLHTHLNRMHVLPNTYDWRWWKGLMLILA